MHSLPNSQSSHLLLFLIVICCCFSCGKEKIELPWNEQTANVNTFLTAVHFTDTNTGHILGGDTWYKGYYLSTTDGGANWLVDSLTDKRMNGIQFTANGMGYAVGISGYLFQKETPLSDWSFTRLPRWDILTDVCYQENGIGLVGGGVAFQHGIIMRLQEGAVTHLDTFENEIATVCFSDEQTAHAAGYGIVLRSDDGAQTWTRLDIDGDFYRAMTFPSSTIGYMVGSAGTIMKTTDGGQDWDKIRDGSKIKVSNQPFKDVFFVDEERGYIVGANGVFWRTENGGDDWQVVKGMPDVDFTSVYVMDGQGYIVSEQGRIFHFQD